MNDDEGVAIHDGWRCLFFPMLNVGWMDGSGPTDGRMNDEGRELLFIMDGDAFFPALDGWTDR